MSRYNFLLIFFLNFFIKSGLFGTCPLESENLQFIIIRQDTFPESQILYNGRVWRNHYYNIKETQYLFSKDFLPGALTISGNTFKNLSIRYDIYNDEIMIPTNHGSILQLNKEMVDSFNITFQNKAYQFTKIEEDSMKGFKGYVNVLYKGKSALYVKYKKEIELLAVDRKYDMFYQTLRIYFLKDGIVHLISGKRDFFNLMDEYKLQIRSFIKKNRIKVSKKIPESFVPVIEFYDSLKQ